MAWLVEWWGGPLDGARKGMDETPAWWVGPDVTEPQTKCVMYHLTVDGTHLIYKFDQAKTNEVNGTTQG